MASLMTASYVKQLELDNKIISEAYAQLESEGALGERNIHELKRIFTRYTDNVSNIEEYPYETYKVFDYLLTFGYTKLPDKRAQREVERDQEETVRVFFYPLLLAMFLIGLILGFSIDDMQYNRKTNSKLQSTSAYNSEASFLLRT